MSKKHEAVFDDVLNGLDTPDAEPRGGARFLKRSTALAERAAGEREEKTLFWVDPAECRMWERHNREYALLNEENCRDLLDGIRAQGRQEFPAIVRRLADGPEKYEVICGARRHFAISWLRANNYAQFRFLVELRDLTDEEAFRLADIENRDRDDISDYERARDYAQAIELYYGGRQKAMAERLEVSEGWLSRYLYLARLPDEVLTAFPTIRDVRELHARSLKPLLADPGQRERLLAEASKIAIEQARAREGQGGFIEAPQVVSRLKGAVGGARAVPQPKIYRRAQEESGVKARRKGKATMLEVPDSMTRKGLQAAFELFLDDRFGK